MKKLFVTLLGAAVLLTAGVAFAQTPATGSSTPPAASFAPLPVTFPIAELGGCATKDACRVYCDDAAHQDACFTYAQSHGLMRKEEVARAKEFIKGHMGSSTPPMASTTPRLAPPPPKGDEGSSTIASLLKKIKGPGGCTTQDTCKAYCSDTTHADECLAFAKAHALMDDRQIQDAKQFLQRVASSTPPLRDPFRPAVGTTTRPDLRAGTSTKPLNLGSTTPPKAFKDLPPKDTKGMPPTGKLPPQTNSGASSSSGSASIDYTKPPYRCTPAQAEEGACDPDQFPGYVAPAQNDQGGNIFLGVLHFFGIH